MTIYALVPTATNGIYQSLDLYAATPVWSTLNTGLGATDVFWLDIDPVTKSELMACTLAASQDSYVKISSADWVSLITLAEFRTETGDGASDVRYPFIDKDESGRIWVIGARFNAAFDAWVYFAYTDDNGSNWTVISLDVDTIQSFLSVRTLAGFYANGQELIFTASNGSDAFLFRSTNLGGAWSVSASIGTSSYEPWTYVRDSIIYTSGNGAGAIDLLSIAKSNLAITVLQDGLNIGPSLPQNMVFIDDNHQRLIKSNKLYITTAAWATVVSGAPSDLSEDGANIIALSEDDDDKTLVARTTSIAVGDPETLTLLPDESGVTLSPLSGASPDSAPFTDSIPYNAGGVVTQIFAFSPDITSVTVAAINEQSKSCQTTGAALITSYEPSWVTPVTYSWSPEPDSGQGTATAVYSTPGTYTVTCTVTGPSNSVEGTINLCLCGSLKWIVYNRCSNFAGLTTLVGNRIYEDSIPEKPVYPLVVHQSPVSSDSSQHRRRRSTPVNRTISRVSFNCHAKTSKGAESVAREVIAAWDAYTDCSLVGWSYYTNRISSGFGTQRVFTDIVDVFIEHCLIT